MLDVGVAHKAARLGDRLLGQPGNIRDPRIEGARGLALRGRAGERGQIFAERKTLGIGLRFLAEGALALELRRRQRRQLQRGAKREPAVAEDEAATRSAVTASQCRRP